MSNTTTVGEFIEWARRNKWTLRNIDELRRSSVYDKEGKDVWGWAGICATSCFFVKDEQIKKELPKRTARDWDAYGR